MIDKNQLGIVDEDGLSSKVVRRAFLTACGASSLGWMRGAALAGGDEPKAPVEARKSVAELLDRYDADWKTLPDTEHIRAIDDVGWKTRMSVLRDLVRMGRDGVTDLIGALESDCAERRLLAAQALGFLGDSRAKNPLALRVEKDQFAPVRVQAVDSLGTIGGSPPASLARRIESADRNTDVQFHIRFAAERNFAPIDPNVIETLKRYDIKQMDSAAIDRPAPDFTLTDVLGETYRLADFRGKKSVVLIFIYGDT